jgi:tetratricopeptide (TPR) repeat protein
MTVLEELMTKGEEARDNFEYEKAIEYFRQGLDQTAAGEYSVIHPMRASFLNCLARIFIVMGRCEKAQSLLEEIFRNASRIPQEKELLKAWIGRGEIANFKGEYEEALSSFQSARELARWMKSDMDQALSTFHMANSLSRLGQIDEGKSALEESLALLNSVPPGSEKDRLLSAIHTQFGLEYLREGKTREAGESFGTALSLTDGMQFCPERAEAFRFLGVVNTIRHSYREGVSQYTDALKIYKKIRHPLGTAKVYNSLGQLCLTLVKPEEALLYLEKGLNICQMLKAEAEAATLYGKLGNVHMMMENYDQAINYFMKDLELSQRFGSLRTSAYTQHNLGCSFIYKGETKEAIAYLTESLRLFKTVDDELNTGKVSQDLCSAYISQGKLDEAERIGREALASFSKLGSIQEEAYTKTLLGVLERHRTNWDIAEKWFLESLSMLNEELSPYFLAETYYEYGLLCMAVRDTDKALNMFKSSLRITRDVGLKSQTSRNLRIIERIDDLALINFLFKDEG